MADDGTADPELEAMREIMQALEKLNGRAARGRVLRWASDRYDAEESA